MIRPRVTRPRDSLRGGGIPNINIGVVVDAPPGTTRISVRLGNLSGRSIHNVAVPDGVIFQSGDRVLLINVGEDPNWIAVTRILDTAESGLRASRTIGERALHPPNNFEVVGGAGLVIASWDAFTGNTVCWEVRHNSTASATGAETFYTRGSYFLYPTTTPETRYVQVRAVRYDVAAYEAWYSRWSNWGYAQSTTITGSAGEYPVVGSGAQPAFHVDGPLAVATHVGGAYIFGSAGTIDSVRMHVKTTGTSGLTRADLNLHRDGGEVSLWVFEASNPTIFASDPDNTVIVVSMPEISEVSVGEKITMDIDAVAVGAVDLDMVIMMRGSSEEVAAHAHSGGLHTGLLAWDELTNSNLIAQVTKRQGGDPTNWSIVGGNSYNVYDPRIQVGSCEVTVLGSTGTDPWKYKTADSVTFPTEFSEVPVVLLTVKGCTVDGDYLMVAKTEVATVSTTGFTFYTGFDASQDRTFTVFWQAIGRIDDS